LSHQLGNFLLIVAYSWLNQDWKTNQRHMGYMLLHSDQSMSRQDILRKIDLQGNFEQSSMPTAPSGPSVPTTLPEVE
jgi:hypothetical protein